LKVKAIIEIDLNEIIQERIETEEELKNFYTSEYNYDENDLKKDEDYQKSIKKIKEGKTILMCTACTDSEEATEQMLADKGLKIMELPKKIEIIKDESRN